MNIAAPNIITFFFFFLTSSLLFISTVCKERNKNEIIGQQLKLNEAHRLRVIVSKWFVFFADVGNTPVQFSVDSSKMGIKSSEEECELGVKMWFMCNVWNRSIVIKLLLISFLRESYQELKRRVPNILFVDCEL